MAMAGADKRKHKPTEPPSLETLAAAYKKVQEFLSQEDYSHALKISSKLPLDGDSGKCRLFCLLQLGRWRPAMDLVSTLQKMQGDEEGRNSPEGGRAYLFEEIYCMYRLNLLPKALETFEANASFIAGLPEDERSRMTHLKAQILHRFGDYEGCQAIYEELLQTDPENEMLLTNFLSSAICSRALRSEERGRGLVPTSTSVALGAAGSLVPREVRHHIENRLTSTYELPFNAACVAIQEGRLEEAEELLHQAKALCKEECGIADVEDDEEAFSQSPEMAGILAQIGYLRDMQHREEEAHEIYDLILRRVAKDQKATRCSGGVIGGGLSGGREEEQSVEVDLGVVTVVQANVYIRQQQQKRRASTALQHEGAEGCSATKTLDDAMKNIMRGSKQLCEQKLSRGQALALSINRCISFIQAGRVSHPGYRWGTLVSQQEAEKTVSGKYHFSPSVCGIAAGRKGGRKGKDEEGGERGMLAAGRPARAEEQLRELLLSSAEGDEAASLPASESIKMRICLATFRLDQNDTSAATRLLREAQGLVLQNVLCSETSSQTPSSSSAPQDTKQRDDTCTTSQILLREIVTLQQLTGDEEGALECLDAQFRFWKDQQRKKGDEGISLHAVTVLLTSASSCLALGRWEEAMDKFQQVLKLLPRNSPEYIQALVGAVEAGSHVLQCNFDQRKGQKDGDGHGEYKMKGSGGAGNGVDIRTSFAARSPLLLELKQKLPQKVLLLDSDEVERHEPTAISSGRKGGGGNALEKKAVHRGEAGEGGHAIDETKKKKKRRPRWPKGFDPSVPQMPPDPERWIRKCER
ncbi:srp72 rna-binding domain-containing protein [Cystoisospora suis]|uniref:Signal recognition particle subunit SRP72 n=1 Tax=Cystoisospora suis TaxID=483139 RepID=A0A2C6KIW2_9APIC|nr:srp72 rna-binding domain-containing protein [Cystoisospora suis]